MVPEINLLPKVERKSAKRRWFSLILTIIFSLLLVFLMIQYFTLTKSIKTLESEQQVLATEKVALEETLAALHKPKGIDLEASVEFVESVSYPVSPLVIEINKYLDENAYLRDYLFSEETIGVEVDFETLSEVVSYIEDLMDSPYFKDVVVSDIETFDPTASDEDEEDQFKVTDRYSNKFEILIDLDYLREVGGGDK